MGVKKTARAKAAAAPKTAAKPARRPKRPRVTRAMGAGAAFVVVAIAAVVMFAARDSAETAEAAAPAASAADAPAPAPAPPPAKPVRAIAGVPARKAAPKVPPADGSAPVVAPKTASELPDAVLIEGCLEQSGETFRLKNTTGADAPKSRSWKSGFLKKGARPVDVVDWNNRLKDHVGKRISVSGMFVDGEMHVRSLRRVAASCN